MKRRIDDEIIYYEADGMFILAEAEKQIQFSQIPHSDQCCSDYRRNTSKSNEVSGIDHKNGGIRCKQVAIASALFIETSNGGIRLEQVQADAIDIHTTNAGIIIQSVLANRCSV